MTPRILIAGIGNIFLGDDAFGVEVARALSAQTLPAGVTVRDFGIRGFDLAYALIDARHDIVVFVDAVRRGGAPGTLYLIEPDVSTIDAEPGAPDAVGTTLDTHNMDPLRVLRFVQAMGGDVDRVMLLGCEVTVPESCEDMSDGLAPPVRAAVPEAVRMILDMVERMRTSSGACHPAGTHCKGSVK